MARGKGQRGFSLIELLIVVTIIGIVAAILIPNLLDALQKAKQKRTVADMRNAGTAWMSWLTDQVGAASAGAVKFWNGTDTVAQGYEQIFGYLHPSDTFFYMQEVPQEDGWKYGFHFGLNPNLLASNVMVICSGGRDGELVNGCAGTGAPGSRQSSDGVHPREPFISTDYDRDIIWADGITVQWPIAPGGDRR